MISVLYVDDEHDLLELAKIFLEQSADFRVDIVTSATDALALPHIGSYDAIVSDYQMPVMDGIAFLKAVRTDHSSLPFILFTGRGREEIVIEAINNGADFYLQKGGDVKAQFAELAHKVRQAVARRQAEISLIESEKRLSDIIDFLPDATFAINRDGAIIAWNRAIEAMTGLQAEAMLGKGNYEHALAFYGERRPMLIDLVLSPDNHLSENYSNISRNGSSITAETNLTHPRGMQITVLAKASPLYNQEGVLVGSIESIRDITERKKADDELRAAYEQIAASEEELREQFDVLAESEMKVRESENRFRSVVQFSPLGMHFYDLDQDGALIFRGANPAADTILGADHSRLIGMEILAAFPGLAGTEIPERYRMIARDGNTWHTDQVMYDKDEITGAFAVDAFQIRPGSMVAVFSDITQRRRTEEALRQKTEELDRFFTTSLDLFCIADTDGYFRRLNPEWERALGYTIAELEGKRFLDFVHPDDLPATLDAISRLKGQEQILNFTNRYRHHDGTYRWIEWRSKPLGKFIFAAARDITSRIDTDLALRKINDRYQSLVDAMHDCVAVYDAVDDGGDFIFLEFNRAASIVEQIKKEDVIGRRVTEVFPGVAEFGLLEVFRRVWKTGKPESFPVSHYVDNRISGWRDNYVYKLPSDEIVADYRDETESKKTEEALRESEEKYRTIFENIQDIYYRADNEGNIVLASPSILPLFGFDSMDEIIGKNIARDLWMYPERRAAFLDELAKHGAVKNYEVVIRRKDGQPVTISTSSHYFHDRNGKVAGVEGIFHDVTALKEADEHIRLLAGLIDISPVSVTVHDADGKFLYANQRTLELHGYTRDEFMALNLHKLDAPESEAQISARIEALRKSGEASFNSEHFRKDGSRIPLHINAKVTRWNDREVIMSVATDLSERFEAEKTLFESEERLAVALAGADLGTWNWNIVTGEVVYNDRWSEMLGYGTDEIVPDISGWKWLIHPDDMSRVMKALNDHLEGRTESYETEHRLRHKDGSWTWVLDRGRVIERDDEGRPLSAAGTHLDITQRKLAQDILQENEERYRNFIENASEGIFRIDFDQPVPVDLPRDVLVETLTAHAVIGEVNAALAAMYGLTPPEMTGRPVRDFAPDCGIQMADLLAMPDYRVIEREEQEVSAAGEPIYIIESYIGIVESGILRRVWGVQRDITYRKRVELALRESEEKFRRIADNARDMIYRMSLPEGNYEYVSPAVEVLTGYTQDEFYSIPGLVRQLIHPDWQEYFSKQWSLLLGGFAPPTYEYQILDRSGQVHWLNQRNVLVKDSDGSPVALEGIVTDITEWKATEKALHDIDVLYRSIIENSHDIIYTIRPDGILTFISPSWTGRIGHEPDDVVGRSYRLLIVPEDIPRCEEYLIETLKTRAVQPGIEFRVFHKDGSIHLYRTTMVPVADENGNVVTLVGNALDFTEHRNAEEALRESEKRYRSVIENIQDGFIQSDREGYITMASPSAARMLGYAAAEELIGLPTDQFYADRNTRQVMVERMAKEGEIVDQLIEMKRMDGTLFWGSVNAHYRPGNDGGPDGVEASIHDVTDYRIMEQATRQANRKLSLLNSITRHDVTNQLTALQGFVQIASMMKGDPVIMDYLARIRGVADTITRQIEFTRTYQELGIQKPAWFSVEEIVARDTSPVPVKFSGSCREIEIYADPMLERVFFNIFDNAVQHGHRVTKITVRCEREPDGVIVIIEDDGIGIPRSEKEKIFGRGYGRHSGLGLFLAKEILAITGISLRETGIHGKGARFEMLVPRSAVRFTSGGNQKTAG